MPPGGDFCVFCEQESPVPLKFLPCEHAGHETCLLSEFRSSGNKCPFDNQAIFPGLMTLKPTQQSTNNSTNSSANRGAIAPQELFIAPMRIRGQPNNRGNQRSANARNSAATTGQQDLGGFPSLIVTRLQAPGPPRRALRNTGATILSR